MSVRVGVDVGGTFTKAVACDSGSGKVLHRAVVMSTHDHPDGVAHGVVQALERIGADVTASGAGPIAMVGHSTTQAVNALLEGDTAVVGVLGIGRGADARRARRRTRLGDVRLAPGRSLRTVSGFLEANDTLDPATVRAAIQELVREGATALCVSEAFSVEDPAIERMALRVAEDLGLPACAGHELSGLYGLEVRTVTAALNAGILPTALRTAEMVRLAAARTAPGVPILVMRGDGGASGIDTMARRPLVTAFSGPAASVAGALRHLEIRDGVVVEIGGTSTNVCAIRAGRPVLAYVRVLDHVTLVRSVDVRVVGVAGGSLIRTGTRLGRPRIVDVGPRSAHIAGLPYAAFSDPEILRDAEVVRLAPRPGDPPEYVVLATRDGGHIALTPTCAANALDEVPTGTYASGNREAARLGFEALTQFTGRDWRSMATEVLTLTAAKVADAVRAVSGEHGLEHPDLILLGGGAGAVGPALGRAVNSSWDIPPDAEVISSIGDAQSLVRVEVEQGMARPTKEAVADLLRKAEDAAVAAGAAPASLQIETEAVPERGALRAVALGSAALDSGVQPGSQWADEEALRRAAAAALGRDPDESERTGHYVVFTVGADGRQRFAVVDRRGSLASSGQGTVIRGSGHEVADLLEKRLPELTRHIGPFSVAPAIRLVMGARLVDLSLFSSPEAAAEAALAECRLAGDGGVVALVSRD